MNTKTTLHIEDRLRLIETKLDALEQRDFYSDLEEYKSLGLLVETDRGETRYVRSTTDGWLTVLIEGKRKSLPSGLKVSLMKTESGRDYGVISESYLKGMPFDVAAGNLVATYDRFTDLKLTVQKKSGKPAVIDGTEYDRDLSLSWKDGGAAKSSGPFHTFTDKDNPINSGTHVVELPDHPHSGGNDYPPHGTVWFRIGNSGDRYVHAGYASAGCLTNNPKTWSEIYEVMHKCRKSDDKSVGTLDFS